MNGSRRQLVASLTLISSIGLLAAACGGDNNGATSATTAAVAASTTAAGATTTGAAGASTSTSSGGAASSAAVPTGFDPNAKITLAIAAPNTGLDPHQAKQLGDIPYLGMVYDTLTFQQADGSVTPSLATEWKTAADGASMTLKLRTGVTFHDGTPFNAAAVKANLDRVKALKALPAANLASVASVDVVDDSTVRINFVPGAGADVPAALSTWSGMMVSPKTIEANTDITANPGMSGSGPYVVTSYKSGESTVFEKAPGTYWNPAVGLTKTIEIDYVAASSARIAGIQSGQYDEAQISGPDVVQAEALAKSGQYGGYGVFVSTQHVLKLHSNQGVLTNEKLRQAIGYAIDKKSIADDLLSGNCKVATSPYPDGHWAHGSTVDSIYNFDLAKAKQLVSESGVANPAVEIVYASGSSFAALVPATQSMLQAAGFKVTATPVPQADVDPMFRGGQKDAYQASISASGDPANIVNNEFLGGFKLYNDADGSLKALADQAVNPKLAQTDRAKLYNDIWTKAAQQFVEINICNTRQFAIYNKDLQGVEQMPLIWVGLQIPSGLTKKG
jgi:peptide/nickel transport system substrate-binding protein